MVPESLSLPLLRLMPEGAWEVVKYDYWSDMVPVYGCKKDGWEWGLPEAIA